MMRIGLFLLDSVSELEWNASAKNMLGSSRAKSATDCHLTAKDDGNENTR